MEILKKPMLTLENYESYEMKSPIEIVKEEDDKVVAFHNFKTQAKNIWKKRCLELQNNQELSLIDTIPKEILEKMVMHHGGKIVW